jgi:polysaccharide pyruvyl transferase WcaK-like protein
LSQARLQQLGVDTEVEVVGDLALVLAEERPVEPADPPRFALNVARQGAGGADTELEAALRRVEVHARELVSRGWKLVPVALHRSDVAPLRSLVSRVVGRETVIEPAETVESFNHTVGPCRFLAGVRLHSAVLSCCIGVPPVMLGYRDKCLDFMESMELTELYVDIGAGAGGRIGDKVSLAQRDSGELRQTVLRRAGAWKARLVEYVVRNRPK